jgi:NADH-quinone oxidoreductase subunit K
MIDLRLVLTLAAVLFCIGVYGVITRKNTIGLLLCVELMANAVNINLVAFAHYAQGAAGQAFALFAIALTVAEVVVGLAIVVLLFRTHKRVDLDAPSELMG